MEMKKFMVLALAASFACGSLAVATDAEARAMAAGIVGSAHDFTNNRDGSDGNVYDEITEDVIGFTENRDESWNYRGEICRVCHAPHDKGRTAWKEWGAETDVSVTRLVDVEGVMTEVTTVEKFSADGLLWNHELSDVEAYPMYRSDSLGGQIAGQVLGKSKLCLSCHDGTVALNAFDGQQGMATFIEDPLNPGEMIPDPKAVFIQDVSNGFTIGPGRDGSGDDFLMGTHPISVAYADGFFPANPKVGVNGGLHDPDGKTFGNVVVMTNAPTVDMVLEQGMVQCHSCHDVHDSVGVNAVGTRLNRAGQGLAANRGADPSGLCLSCHNK